MKEIRAMYTMTGDTVKVVKELDDEMVMIESLEDSDEYMLRIVFKEHLENVKEVE